MIVGLHDGLRVQLSSPVLVYSGKRALSSCSHAAPVSWVFGSPESGS